MFCRHCGKEINEKAEYCIHCGCSPLTGTSYCQECGSETLEKQEICIKCGVRLKKQNKVNCGNLGDRVNDLINGDTVKNENFNFSPLSNYYQEEFQKIHETDEAYTGKWNWCAFFFTWIWALTKGLWVLSIVILIASLLLGTISYGIGGLIIWIYTGVRGNHIYYNKYVKGQQTLF